jgi:hypothetical protein
MVIFHWFLTFTGTRDESSTWYGFWSGFGGSIPDFLLLGTLWAIYKRNKCQSCRRLVLKGGLGKVEGTHYETCRKHTNAAEHETLKAKHKLLHPEMHAHLNKETEQ